MASGKLSPSTDPPCSVLWRTVCPEQQGSWGAPLPATTWTVICRLPTQGIPWQFPTTPLRQFMGRRMHSQSSSARANWRGMLPRARYGGQQGQPTLRHSSRTYHSTSTCRAGKRHLRSSLQSLALSLLHSPAGISTTSFVRLFVPQAWSMCSAIACYWQYGSAL